MPRLFVFLLTFLLLMVGLLLPFNQVGDVVYAAPPLGGTVEYCSTDGPQAINVLEAVSSTINVPDNATITDLNVKLNIDHSQVGDLRIELVNNTTTRTLLQRPNNGNGQCSGDDITNNIADDEAINSFSASCANSASAYTDGASYQAGQPAAADILAAYDGRNIAGAWTLNIVHEPSNVRGGTFQSWCMQFEVNEIPPTSTATPLPTNTPIATNTLPPNSTSTATVPPSSTPTRTNTPPPNSTSTATVPPSATPTRTNTPVPNTPTATTTPLPPGTERLYGPLVLLNTPRTCQSIENESLNPNNTTEQALSSLPLCFGETLRGKHDVAQDREDIYRFEAVSGDNDELILLQITLDVPDTNLNLYLFDENRTEIGRSLNTGTQDEVINAGIGSGTYFVRVYRTDNNTSSADYRLTVRDTTQGAE